MKKVLAFILALSILTLAGCSKTGDMLSDTQSDLSSQNNIITSDIVSSTESEDISSEEVSSDDTSSQTSEIVSTPSAETVTSSTTESTTPPVVSNTETPSVSTPTTTEPKNYLEQNELKTITLNDNYCLNEEAHECVTISCGIKQRELDDDPWAFIPETEKKSDYIYVDAIFNGYCGAHAIIAFDKYTGIVLNARYTTAKYLNINDTEVLAFQTWGGGGDNYKTCNTIIPKNYDGLMFLVANENIDYREFYDKQEATTVYLADIIDLKNDKYYLFAVNS